MSALNVLVALMIFVGLLGIVVPLLPGLLLVWAAVLLWAIQTQTTGGWAVLGVATILAVSGFLLQYLLPGRQMARAGVTTSSTVAGAALAIVGFFVVPIVGALVGFPVGIYLAERVKQGSHAAARTSTTQAVKAVGLSLGIELLAGLAIATTWLIGVTTTTS